MVAHTKMHHERKVVSRLNAQGIEAFTPLTKEVRKWSDRNKLVEVLVVSMTIFVKVNEQERLMVLQDPSVSYFMIDRMTNKPAVIPDDQVEAFRYMLNQSDGPVQLNPNLLQKGEKVTVIRGPLRGLIGHFSEYQGKGILTIEIDVLGYASVEMPASNIDLFTHTH